ncbi:peptidylprolyl isomerase [Brevundimonas sp.]|uniref:peptidylprolyl isomerase n=1 Tax=Brevundimonas sp. TaxID=1871086 RepID=UPI003BAC79B5
MDRRTLSLTLLLSLLAAPALAQTVEAEAAPVAAPVAAMVAPQAREHVVLTTSAGDIVIALDPAAPVTSANFLRYVDDKRFDGTDFYRGMVIAPGMGLIQGGANNAPNRILPPIPDEPTSQTGLRHTDGAVSMARYEPGSATGDFFIILGDVPSLDASASDPGFAVFGHVIDGMDVVRQILAAPKSATEGEGFMRGQMLDPRIAILSARRLAVTVADPR